MPIREYGVSINGCPYLFTSHGISVLPTPAAEDAADWSPDWTVAQGFFDWENSPLAWSEKMRPLDAGLDCGPQNFRLMDGIADGGPCDGHNLFTWLATREEEVLTSTVLAATIPNGLQPGVSNGRGSTGPASFDVADGSSASSPVVWIDGEAILCDLVSGDSITINAAGRGYYGSFASAHVIDPTSGVYPEVWTEFPWATKRRVILWIVDGVTNVAKAHWRGFCQRAPRMLDDLAKYELQCEGIYTRIKDARLGNPTASTYIRGFQRKAVRFVVEVNGLTPDGGSDFDRGLDAIAPVYDTLEQLLQDKCAKLRRDLAVEPGVTAVNCGVSFWQNGWQVSLSANGLTDLKFTVQLGEESYTATSTTALGVTRRAVVQIPHSPAVLAVFGDNHTAPVPIAVVDITDLPASGAAWVPPAYRDDDTGYLTQIRYSLRGDYDSDRDLLIEPSYIDPVAPSITGPTRFVPKDPTTTLHESPNAAFGFIDRQVRLDLVASVRSPHWALALKHCVEDTDVVSAGIDLRDMDFSNLTKITNASASFFARREFLFDGSQRFGQTATDNALISGCGLGIRGSRVSFISYGIGARTDSPAAVITEDDLCDKATATPLPDGLACAIEIDANTRKVTIIDARSVGRYGRSRTIAAKLDGQIEALNALRNPRAIASMALSKVVSNWSRPLWYVTLPLNLSFLDETPIYQGDTVTLSESFLPDGAGGRGLGNAASLVALGLVGRSGFVLDRDVDIHAGRVTLGVVLRGQPRGYAPCCRISSITGAVATIAGPVYVGSPVSDHAGSNRAGYNGTANDGGASKFKPGDTVEILRRDCSTYVKDSLVVLSVNPATPSITFTAAIPTVPNDWHFNVNGGFWQADIRYDLYTTANRPDAQKNYAWVGDQTSGVIGGTADRNHQWGP